MAEAIGVNKRRVILCTIFAAAFAAIAPIRGSTDWLTDYNQAQQQAKTSHKLLLLNFTGSDWCGWCIRLDREVFSRPEFKDYADKNLVLMEADFPRGKTQPATLKRQNEELAAQYQVLGFPTIVVLNGEGRKIGELGYVPGGPNAFIEQLEKLRKG